MNSLPTSHQFPSGPIIEELSNLVPLFPTTGDPRDEAIFFAYSQIRIAYVFLSNLLENTAAVIGIYLYTWSILDNAARLHNLLHIDNDTVRTIRNAFQHMDEKLDQYKEAIPVYGAVTWICQTPGQEPTFHHFPEKLGRSFYVGVLKGVDPITPGVSHVTLSALPSQGPKDTVPRQITLRIDHLVLTLGRVVCDKFGKGSQSLPLTG